MKAINLANKNVNYFELGNQFSLGGFADFVAFVSAAVAKRKLLLCVVRYMWRAHSDRGRWLG